MRFSASRLKLHMSCSLAASYKYEHKLPTRQNGKVAFGKIIHIALAYYYDSRGDHAGALAKFKGLWARPERVGITIDYWPKLTSFDRLMGKGIEIINQVHETHKWKTFTLIGTEIPFLVPFGDHELTGYVDLLGLDRSGTGKELLTITDHKTATKKPSIAELALDVQFTVYLYATYQREFWVGGMAPEFPGLPNGEWLWETVGKMADRRSVWNHLWTQNQIDAGPRTVGDFERLYRVCTEIEKAVNLGVAVPTIGSSCTWCDYQEPCELEIPVSIAAKTDKTDATRWI